MLTNRWLLFFWLTTALFSSFPTVAQNANDSARGGQSLGAGNAAIASTNSMDVLDDKRPLAIGDRVSYRIVEERMDPRSLVVADSGEMEVPLIGRIHAASKTCRQLALDIKKELEKDYFNRATVIIGLDAASVKSRGVIYVMGAVRNQGVVEIPLEGTFTVSKAILRAGGFSDFANQRKVKLIRKGVDSSETIAIDVKEILYGTGTKDPVVQQDDVVIVPENRVNF